MAEVKDYYDELSSFYHLIFTDFDQEVDFHGEWFKSNLLPAMEEGPLEVLDCACGIGTQMLALAGLGHRVTGTDISAGAIDQARSRLECSGQAAPLHILDMRQLGVLGRDFDLVVALDNALPHLVSASDLEQALRAVRSVTRPGGRFLASIRDYDSLKTDRPTMLAPMFVRDPGSERISFQIWNWISDEVYEVHEHMTMKPDGEWRHRHAYTLYRAYSRAEISALLRVAGFSRVDWKMPDESGYRQPVVWAS